VGLAVLLCTLLLRGSPSRPYEDSLHSQDVRVSGQAKLTITYPERLIPRRCLEAKSPVCL
jgi:hypothetical protein